MSRDPQQSSCLIGGAETLLSALVDEATTAPLTLLRGLDATPYALGRDELVTRSLRVARRFRELGMAPGDRVMMLLPTDIPFVTSLFGAWFNQAVSVPVVHRASARNQRAWLDKLTYICRIAKPRFIVGTEDSLAHVRAALDAAGETHPPALLSERDIEEASSRPGDPPPSADPPPTEAIAHCQFTSGSTGEPKGVLLTHGQIVRNLDSAAERVALGDEDRFLSWLPLHHDMGFIGGLLFPLYAGIHQFLMPTEAFARAPHLWPQLISRHRASLSPAPTFAYDLLTHRVPDSRLKKLDLSCWRYAWVGAEPIFQQTLDGFRDRFAPSRLPQNALAPCYGLAEATLAVTAHVPNEPARILWVEREPLRSDGVVEIGAEHDTDSVPLVGVGSPLSWASLKIVDDRGAPVADGREGRIELDGDCACRQQLTADGVVEVHAPLDTGDLGFVLDGELFITGRAKDLLIRGGVNTHPQWIERVADGDKDVRPGRSAAVSLFDHVRQKEEIVLVIEPARYPPRGEAELRRRIAARVAAETGLQLDRVECVPPGTVPKTSSGKVQRRLVAALVQP